MGERPSVFQNLGDIFRIAKIYSLVKTMIPHALQKKQHEQKDILHTIKIFEGKFEVVCKAIFGIVLSFT
jgi:hypothetical protein